MIVLLIPSSGYLNSYPIEPTLDLICIFKFSYLYSILISSLYYLTVIKHCFFFVDQVMSFQINIVEV